MIKNMLTENSHNDGSREAHKTQYVVMRILLNPTINTTNNCAKMIKNKKQKDGLIKKTTKKHWDLSAYIFRVYKKTIAQS